jgi:glycosyltransferase involved in cell wall biosynthesis
MAPGSAIIVCANLAWNLVNFRAGLIAALRDRGWRVIAAAPPDPAMEQRLRAMGCEFEPVPIDASGISPWRDLQTIRAFGVLIRKHRPAAWLSWTIKPNTYGSFVAAQHGVPAFPNVSGLGTAFIRRSILTAIAKRLHRTGFRRAPAVLFQNTDDRDLFVGQGLVRPEQVRLLPGSGIDTKHFFDASGKRPARRNFLMLSRLVADKGVREYVAAAKTIRAQWPDARFRLVGPAEVANRTAISREELDGWIAEGAIEWSEPLDDVRPAIAAADFVVLPSYREGMSRVLLEAAAMGRPCVTADVPGCRDVVSDGVNGYLCAARDANALAGALARAAQADDAEWQAMAKAGRARAITEFSQERVTALYLEALAEAGIIPAPSAG